jgi:hypothetical protein
MKPVTFENQFTHERVICDDSNRNIQVIDGVEYLSVHRTNSNRTFLIRRDSLKQVNEKTVK